MMKKQYFLFLVLSGIVCVQTLFCMDQDELFNKFLQLTSRNSGVSMLCNERIVDPEIVQELFPELYDGTVDDDVNVNEYPYILDPFYDHENRLYVNVIPNPNATSISKQRSLVEANQAPVKKIKKNRKSNLKKSRVFVTSSEFPFFNLCELARQENKDIQD